MPLCRFYSFDDENAKKYLFWMLEYRKRNAGLQAVFEKLLFDGSDRRYDEAFRMQGCFFDDAGLPIVDKNYGRTSDVILESVFAGSFNSEVEFSFFEREPLVTAGFPIQNDGTLVARINMEGKAIDIIEELSALVRYIKREENPYAFKVEIYEDKQHAENDTKYTFRVVSLRQSIRNIGKITVRDERSRAIGLFLWDKFQGSKRGQKARILDDFLDKNQERLDSIKMGGVEHSYYRKWTSRTAKCIAQAKVLPFSGT